MQHSRRDSLAKCVLVMGLVAGLLPCTAFGQVKEGDPAEAPAKQKPGRTTGSKPEPVPGNAPDAPGTTTPRPPVNPKLIRVFLMDGSVIAGELSVDSITVTTEFGKLVVPVQQILNITPGLESHTKLSEQIKRLVEELGSDDYKTREQSHKDLLAMGPSVRDVVNEFTSDKNAERKRHATEIVQKLDESAEEIFDEDEDSSAPKAWVRHDLVVTPNFTIAGRISPSVFKVASKYGPLNLSLNDIKKAERETNEVEMVAKRLTLPGNTVVQRGMKSSGVRVEAGDTVTISAEGKIVMTPWGSNMTSGPDGGSNFGNYQDGGQQFFGGALVARVGDSGPLIKVGSKAKFVIKKTGVLKFGVAMNNSYAGNGYFFPGDYKLRLRVAKK